MIEKNDRNWELLRRLSKIVDWDKVKAVDRKPYYIENKDNGNKNKYRSRVAMIELYPEHLEDLAFLYQLVVSGTMPYACIVHDKDKYQTDMPPDENGNGGHKKGDPVKLHIHVVVCFENGKTNTAVAKMFKLNPQFIEMWDSKKEALKYLNHCGYPEKFQYDFDEIYGNLSCEIYQATTHIHDKYLAIDRIVNHIECCDFTSMIDIYHWCVDKKILETYFNQRGFIQSLVMEHNSILKMIADAKKEGKI